MAVGGEKAHGIMCLNIYQIEQIRLHHNNTGVYILLSIIIILLS